MLEDREAVGYVVVEAVPGILAVEVGLEEVRSLLAVGREGVRIVVEGVELEPGGRNLEGGLLAHLEGLEVGRTRNLGNVGCLVDLWVGLVDLSLHLEELMGDLEDLNQMHP